METKSETKKPMKEMSVEERREYNRASKRNSRARKAQAEKAVSSETEQEWWSKNIEALRNSDPGLLEKYHASAKDADDVTFWMEHGHLFYPEDGEIFQSLETILTSIEAFTREHGLLHTGYYRMPEAPEDYFKWCVADCACAKPTSKNYWQDKNLFEAVCRLSPGTEIFARYGIATALSDWRVEQFKNRALENGVPSEARWRSGLSAWAYDEKLRLEARAKGNKNERQQII